MMYDSEALKIAQEHVKRQQELINNLVLPKLDISNFINTEVLEQISKSYFPILEASKSLSKSILPIIDVFKNFDSEIFKEFFNEFGWLEAISCTYADELQRELKEKGKDAVWNKLISDLNNEKWLNEFEEDFSKVQFIQKRLHILKKVIEHHKKKDFISSIPLLLSQIEGMLWDLGIKNRLIENKQNSRIKIDSNGGVCLNTNGKPINCGLDEVLVSLFGTDSKLREHTRTKVYSDDLRNPIMHGRQVTYNNEKNSTMLILMLFNIIEKIKDETKN